MKFKHIILSIFISSTLMAMEEPELYFSPDKLDVLNEKISYFQKTLGINSEMNMEQLSIYVEYFRRDKNNLTELLNYYALLGNRDLLQNKEVDFDIRKELRSKYQEFFLECHKTYNNNIKKSRKIVHSYDIENTLTDKKKARIIASILMGIRVITHSYCLGLLSNNKDEYLFFPLSIDEDTFDDDRDFPLKTARGNCGESTNIIAYFYQDYLTYIYCDMFEVHKNISHCFTVIGLDEYIVIVDPYAYDIFVIKKDDKNNDLIPIMYHGKWYSFCVDKNITTNDEKNKVEFANNFEGSYFPYPILGTRDNFIALLATDSHEKLDSLTKNLHEMNVDERHRFFTFFYHIRLPILEKNITKKTENTCFLDNKKITSMSIFSLHTKMARKIIKFFSEDSKLEKESCNFYSLIYLLFLCTSYDLKVDFNDINIIIHSVNKSDFKCFLFNKHLDNYKQLARTIRYYKYLLVFSENN